MKVLKSNESVLVEGKSTTTSLLTLVAVVAVVGMLMWGPSVLAIGQLSKPIVVSNVLRGQAIPETLTLFNSEKEAREFGLTAGGDIAKWATFYLPEDLATPITKISIPAESSAKAAVVITVPSDTPNGRYSGSLSVTYTPEALGDVDNKSAAVRQSVDRPVTITVTDQEIVKLEAAVIPVTYQLAANEPLVIKLNYRNLGNVSVKPQAQLKIFRDQKNVADTIFPYLDEEAIKPLTSKSLQVEWPTSGLADGRYRAEVTVLVNGAVQDSDSFKFLLGSPRVLGASIFSGFGAGGNFTSLLIITIIGLLILAVLVFIAVQLWQKNKQTSQRAGRGKSLSERTVKRSTSDGIGFVDNAGKDEPAPLAGGPESKSSRRRPTM